MTEVQLLIRPNLAPWLSINSRTGTKLDTFCFLVGQTKSERLEMKEEEEEKEEGRRGGEEEKEREE